MSVLYFLVLIGALVVIHELGHFVAAKLLDIKVLRFSLGFGRPLVRVRGGETEYQIGIVPFGGYVRILGEEDTEPAGEREARRSLAAKPLWQRLVVVFAGPAANFLFPVLIYFLLFAGQSTLPSATVGDVVEGGPAARAGIEPGDRVVAVNGEGVRYWEDFKALIDAHVGDELRLRVRRGDRELEKFVVPTPRTVRSRDGRSAHEGWLGVSQAPFPAQVGVIDADSPAARAGLRTGDLVISVDGAEVHNWTALAAALDDARGRRAIAYLRGEPVPGIPQVRVLSAGMADLVPEPIADARGRLRQDTGIAPAEMFITHVEPGSPAARAGLARGDLITTLDGEPVRYWMLLDQALQRDPERVWRIGWLRRGPSAHATAGTGLVRQDRREVIDEFGNVTRRLRFGASNDFDPGDGDRIAIERRLSYAASKAVERTGDTIVQMAAGGLSIIRGETPHDSVGGPLMMYRVASVSGSKGWDAFLLMLALISVNLGLINLLPVPMLDGGNVVLFALETATRAPLSPRARARIMMCGLAVVAAITVLALRNDIMRLLVQ
jgi:regulator of sigma E protease